MLPYSCLKVMPRIWVAWALPGSRWGGSMLGPVFWLILAVVSLALGGYAALVGLRAFGGPDILVWFPLGAAAGLGFLGFSCVRQAIDQRRR